MNNLRFSNKNNYVVRFLFCILNNMTIIIRIIYKRLTLKRFEQFIKFIILNLVINIYLLYNCVIPRSMSPQFLFLNNNFIYTPIIFYIKIFICIIAICIFIAMLDYFKYEKFVSYELPILILLSMEGMFLLISANDYFVMYIALELQSIPLYILAASKRYSNVSVEAGLKYFIYGSFASAMILYGISLIYGNFAATDFSTILTLLYTKEYVNENFSLFLTYGLLLISLGLFFKLGLAPMHWWVPDIYEGVPTLITFYFSVLPKISVLFIFYRAYAFCLNPMLVLSVYSQYFVFMFICCAIFSIFFGSIGAIYQTKIKQLLAYSTIANLGFMLLGLSTISVLGLIATMYYFLIYIMASVQIFYIICIIRRQGNFAKIKNIVEFVALSKSNFVLSAIFVFGLLSFAGIPPLAGFYGKALIFMALIAKGQYLLAVIGVLFSVLTCVYYIRLIRFIWFSDNYDYPIYNLIMLTERQAHFIAILSVLNLGFFFYQGPLLLFFHHFAFWMIDCNLLF